MGPHVSYAEVEYSMHTYLAIYLCNSNSKEGIVGEQFPLLLCPAIAQAHNNIM